MTTPTVFQTSSETHDLVMTESEQPAALLINPIASASTLLSAVETRVLHLLHCLNGWAETAPGHNATPEQIVAPSLFLAEQVQMLLAEMRVRMRAEGNTP